MTSSDIISESPRNAGGRHRRLRSTAAVWVALALTGCHTIIRDGVPRGHNGEYVTTFRVDWNHGIDENIGRQAARSDSITVVPIADFGGMALKTTIDRGDDFHSVANGSPRAELVFGTLTRFAVGGDYEIRWSTMIPFGEDIDRLQPEIITQIHQSAAAGAPALSLMLVGDRYQMDIRGAHAARSLTFGNSREDLGRRTSWLLRYRPDDTGASAVSDLYKDGVLVVSGGRVENAYPDDKAAYLKLGIYKWNWKFRPSEVVTRTIYYGNLEVRSRPGS